MTTDIMRVHVYSEPLDLLDAARFIASTLLLSHKLRVDTVSAVRLKNSWIIVRGDRVRHLRPDEESLEGWIKAVLKGKKLGAEISLKPIDPIGLVACITLDGDKPLYYIMDLGEPITVTYGTPVYECKHRLRPELDLPVFIQAGIVNMLLDNARVGLRSIGSLTL